MLAIRNACRPHALYESIAQRLDDGTSGFYAAFIHDRIARLRPACHRVAVTAPPGDVQRLRTDAIQRLEGINSEITYAFVHRQIYTELRDEIVARRPESDATFINSYSTMYAFAHVMAVRRLADSHEAKPESLWWLIESIRRNPAIAAREHLLTSVRMTRSDEPWVIDETDRRYTERWGNGPHPPDDRLRDMQRQLRDEMEKVIAFADKRVAHRDPGRDLLSLTYTELHEAVDHAARIANEIGLLLQNTSTAFWACRDHR